METNERRFGNGGHASREQREGLLLCMFLAVLMDEERQSELLREIALITSEEPDFTGQLDEFEKVLADAQADLHKGPDELMARIRRLLGETADRRRGLELAVRVVTADGIVTRGQRSLIRSLGEHLDLPEEAVGDAIVFAQKRLVRFMMVYLVYLTVLADGKVRSEEFEEMIPFVLSLPAFRGVRTEEYERIVHSVRDHLEEMRTEKGIEYITATLRNAAELLEDDGIPAQALQMVARGIFADREVAESEREFFLQIAKRLGVDDIEAASMMSVAR